jgi:hypothetical protein
MATRPGAIVVNILNEKISQAGRRLLGDGAEIFKNAEWKGLTYRAVKIFLIDAPSARRGCLFLYGSQSQPLEGVGERYKGEEVSIPPPTSRVCLLDCPAESYHRKILCFIRGR